MPRKINFSQLMALRIFNVDLICKFVRTKIDNWNFLLEFKMAPVGIIEGRNEVGETGSDKLE